MEKPNKKLELMTVDELEKAVREHQAFVEKLLQEVKARRSAAEKKQSIIDVKVDK